MIGHARFHGVTVEALNALDKQTTTRGKHDEPTDDGVPFDTVS